MTQLNLPELAIELIMTESVGGQTQEPDLLSGAVPDIC